MKALSYPLAFTLTSTYIRKILDLYHFCNNAYIGGLLGNWSWISVPWPSELLMTMLPP